MTRKNGLNYIQPVWHVEEGEQFGECSIGENKCLSDKMLCECKMTENGEQWDCEVCGEDEVCEDYFDSYDLKSTCVKPINVADECSPSDKKCDEDGRLCNCRKSKVNKSWSCYMDI